MIGQKLGSFRIEAELGSGAMGVVYRGVQEGKDRQVAIKVIANEQIGKGKAFERFEREAEILEQFRHPNIVRYIARGKSGGTFYYAMEYVSGPTLDKVLRDRGVIPWRKVAAIGIQLCEALQYSHDHGVIHRDLKPSNLMLTETGQLKLTDFGIAKDLDATEQLTGTGRTLGTAAYMAPEQIRGTPEISHKTDLYALGTVLYQMLTGDAPFTGASAVVMMHMHMNEPPPRASKKVEEIPKALDELIVALMAKSPSDRPWDATAVGQVLRGLLEKTVKKEPIPMVWPEPGSAASMPQRAEIQSDEIGPRPPRPRKKKKKKGFDPRLSLETAGLVAALVVISGIIGYLLKSPSQAYLYQHAETLMASTDPLEWGRAREKYLDPLDRDYPQHPYKEKTEAWRDQIDLRETRRRAEILEKPNLGAYSKPKDEAEALYVHAFEESWAALKLHNEQDAESLWRDVVKQLSKKGRENRGWILLAKSKADGLAAAITLRRETVAGLLAKATLPDVPTNKEAYSLGVYRDIVKRFDIYPDVADLVARARAGLAELENVKSDPSPEAASPGSARSDPDVKP